MELIRKYFTVIKAQLVGLTVSQKLLIGLLALVMFGTVFFTVVFSAKPQMVPLLAQPMSAEDINKVKMALEGKYPYQVSGDKVLVPTEDAYAIRGELAADHALPVDTSTSFSSMIRNSSLFNSERMNERAWNDALQQELAKHLQTFPYLESGSVIISEGEKQTLGRQPTPSTASVYVRTKGGAELTENQAMAIVDLVKGAVAGMKRENVNVIANGEQTFHAPDGDTPIPANLLAVKKTMEDYLRGKLADQFREVGNVKITVNVVPDLAVRHISSTSYDPKSTVVKTVQSSDRTMDSSDGATVGGEPGVVPNTSAAVDGGSNGGKKSASSTTDHTERNEAMFGSTTEERMQPAGSEMKKITASLSFPRSYFLSIFRRQKGDDKANPADADLVKEVIQPKLTALLALAKNAIGVESDDQIHVDWFDDAVGIRPPETVLAQAGSAGGIGGMALVQQYAKQGILAIVALGALGMMLMMVKKAVPAGADTDVDTGVFFGAGGKGRKKGSNVEQLEAADDVFGEANQGEAVLTGIELDDETLASRKMVDEVSVMIKENPENAAALVKRWMAKSK